MMDWFSSVMASIMRPVWETLAAWLLCLAGGIVLTAWAAALDGRWPWPTAVIVTVVMAPVFWMTESVRTRYTKWVRIQHDKD